MIELQHVKMLLMQCNHNFTFCHDYKVVVVVIVLLIVMFWCYGIILISTTISCILLSKLEFYNFDVTVIGQAHSAFSCG